MPVDDRILAALPFFSWLSAAQRRALSRVLDERRYPPDGIIFEKGQPGLSCGFVVAGTVSVEVDAGPERPPEVIDSMGLGQVFGEVALLDGGPRSATCRAGPDGAVVAQLSRADFTLLFEADSPFAFAMVRQIASQLARRMRRAARIWRETATDDPAGGQGGADRSGPGRRSR